MNDFERRDETTNILKLISETPCKISEFKLFNYLRVIK